MKTFYNLLFDYTIDQLENIIKEAVIDRFGFGTGGERKCVVVWDKAEQEDAPFPFLESLFSDDKPKPLGLDDDEDVKILFEGTLEECHIYSEMCQNMFSVTLVVYSEEMYKRLYE